MGTWSEWAVAGGTLALALVTAVMAWQTRGVAGATKDAARAAAEEAKASADTVAEIQRDRELNWRPYPFLTTSGRYGTNGTDPDSFDFVNIGRGPAFNCVYAHYFERPVGGGRVVPEWRSNTKPAVIPAAGGAQGSADLQPHPIPTSLFQDADGKMADPAIAVFYQDTLSNTAYRLLPPRAKPDVWRPGMVAEQWVTWYFGWIGVKELPKQ